MARRQRTKARMLMPPGTARKPSGAHSRALSGAGPGPAVTPVTPAAATPPQPRPRRRPHREMNCICVPASSITSPLRSGTDSPTSGTPLTLGRDAPSTCAKA